MRLQLINVFLLLSIVAGKSAVTKLTQKNFKKQVLQSSDVWLVEFMAPWCGHCKQLQPEWEAAAKKTQDKVRFGVVDCTSEEKLASKYGIQGYPTIKVFGEKKNKPIDYPGGRTAADLVQYVNTQLNTASTLSSAMMPFLEYKDVYSFLNPAEKISSVVLLFVQKPKKAFKAPSWLKKIVKKNMEKKKTRVAIVTKDQSNIAKRFQIHEDQLPAAIFAHVKYETFASLLPSGIVKLNEEVLDTFITQQQRETIDEIKAHERLPAFPAPDVPKQKPKLRLKQMSSKSDYEKCFVTKKNMCVLLLSQERKKDDVLGSHEYETLKAMAKKFRRDPFDFFWLHESSWQANIRESFALPTGAASILVMKAGKRPRFSTYEGHVHRTGAVESFLEDIIDGLESFSPISSLPDYKDGKEQEEYDHIEL